PSFPTRRSSDLDEAVEDLLKEIDQVESDVNILFYGDHFPSLFRGTEDRFSRKEIHETPWFLYMNHGRSKDGIHLKGLSPAFFTTVLLREGDYYVSPFQALMDQLLSEDVRRIGDDFIITDAGKINDNDLSSEVIQLVNDYRLVVYDSLFGKNKLGDKFFLEKGEDRKSTRLNSSHVSISYAVFCLKKKKNTRWQQ